MPIPLHLPSGRIERDQAVAVEVAAVVSAAPVVVGAITFDFFDGEEEDATLLVHREHSPKSRRGIGVCASVEPRGAIRIARLRFEVERPPKFARDGVESLDRVALAGLGQSPRDKQIFVNKRRGVVPDSRKHAVITEGRDQRSRPCIDRRQTGRR